MNTDDLNRKKENSLKAFVKKMMEGVTVLIKKYPISSSVFSLIFLVIFLLNTGFCFEKFRYVNLKEIAMQMYIDRIIKEDRKARIEMFKAKGEPLDLEQLEKQYEKERQKFFTYCHDGGGYCRISEPNHWTLGEFDFTLSYNFDPDSLQFFNEVEYIYQNYKDNETYHIKYKGQDEVFSLTWCGEWSHEFGRGSEGISVWREMGQKIEKMQPYYQFYKSTQYIGTKEKE